MSSDSSKSDWSGYLKALRDEMVKTGFGKFPSDVEDKKPMSFLSSESKIANVQDTPNHQDVFRDDKRRAELSKTQSHGAYKQIQPSNFSTLDSKGERGHLKTGKDKAGKTTTSSGGTKKQIMPLMPSEFSTLESKDKLACLTAFPDKLDEVGYENVSPNGTNRLLMPSEFRTLESKDKLSCLQSLPDRLDKVGYENVSPGGTNRLLMSSDCCMLDGKNNQNHLKSFPNVMAKEEPVTVSPDSNYKQIPLTKPDFRRLNRKDRFRYQFSTSSERMFGAGYQNASPDDMNRQMSSAYDTLDAKEESEHLKTFPDGKGRYSRHAKTSTDGTDKLNVPVMTCDIRKLDINDKTTETEHSPNGEDRQIVSFMSSDSSSKLGKTGYLKSLPDGMDRSGLTKNLPNTVKPVMPLMPSDFRKLESEDKTGNVKVLPDNKAKSEPTRDFFR